MTTTETTTTLPYAPNYNFEEVTCLQCGSKKSTHFLVGEEDLTAKDGKFTYVKCQDCELVYQSPRIAVNQIKDFYDSEYIAHRKKNNWGILQPLYERAMNKHDLEKIKIVQNYVELNSKTEVLDVGCAVGTFLLKLKKDFNCDISGVDFKEDLTYPDFDKINFYCGLFYEQDFKDKKFDLVTMWHFLEHCYQPQKSLAKAHSVLKTGGTLIIEVPRLDSLSYKIFKDKWPGVQAPQHTVLFDKESLLTMVTNSGYKLIEYLPYGAFPPYFYLFAGTWFKLFGKGLNLDKAIAPYFAGQIALAPMLMMQKKLNLAMQTIICEKI